MTPDAAGRPERSDLTVDQHRMVAPSRVWLMPPPGDPTWYAGTWKSNPLTVVVGDVPYVPESRALAAERERDKWKEVAGTWADKWKVADADLAALREQVATLTAELDTLRASGGRVRGTARTLREERDAMVPLARLGLGGLDGGSYYLDVLVRLGVSKPTGEETPATIAAREILGRVP